MTWPQTINGTTYTESDFARYGYITAFPACLADIIAHVANSLTGTSSSSVAVGTGSKSLTASTGRSWIVGQPVRIARTSAPTTTYMDGTVTAYNSGTGAMTVSVASVLGTGTHTDWSISVTGTAGGGGGVTGPGSSTDNAIARFDGTGGATLQNSGVIVSDANAVTGVASLTLASGATVTEFSTDDTMAGNSDAAVPTEQSVKAYVDGAITNLTADSTPAIMADYVATYDASATTNKKVLLDNLPYQNHPNRVRGFNDFISSVNISTNTPIGSDAGWVGQFSGTGATGVTQHGAPGTYDVLGVINFRTGTTTTGRAGFCHGSVDHFGPGHAGFDFTTRLRHYALSIVTDEYITYVGFGDNFSTSGAGTDRVYFRYDRLTDGDYWACITYDGTETKTVTAVAPATAAYERLRITINEAGTEVKFYIDGTLVATHTTNIPTSTTNGIMGYGAKIEKSAGTTQTYLYVDYVQYDIVMSTRP